VVVSSISGYKMAFNFHYAYSISKAGLIAMTKSLANELSAKMIRVNAVAPGMVSTPLADKLNQDNYFTKIDKAKYLLGKDMQNHQKSQM
jgi:3-oxoacyl-[acyl-carrier protein] reductase